jgi:hypothetical protein
MRGRGWGKDCRVIRVCHWHRWRGGQALCTRKRRFRGADLPPDGGDVCKADRGGMAPLVPGAHVLGRVHPPSVTCGDISPARGEIGAAATSAFAIPDLTFVILALEARSHSMIHPRATKKPAGSLRRVSYLQTSDPRRISLRCSASSAQRRGCRRARRPSRTNRTVRLPASLRRFPAP